MSFTTAPPDGQTVVVSGTNGYTTAGEPEAPKGPRLPKRLVWLDLPEDSYPGFRIRVWVNAPQRVFTALDAAQETDALKDALKQLVVEHNDWCTFDGAPFPPASDGAFWDEVPNELAGAVIALLMGEVGKLATSLLPQRRQR